MIAVQFLLICTTMFGLPGNAISLIIPIIFLLMHYIKLKIFIILLILVAVGEILEFYIGYIGGKFFGISKKSFWVSVIFGIIFGILMAPLFLGIGALIGLFLGTFSGTFLYEYSNSKNLNHSIKLGFYSLFSRLTGTFIKFGIGILTIYLTLINV